ncbi:hypothetical protein ES703_113621 [subsurface metagenome]
MVLPVSGLPRLCSRQLLVSPDLVVMGHLPYEHRGPVLPGWVDPGDTSPASQDPSFLAPPGELFARGLPGLPQVDISSFIQDNKQKGGNQL